MTQYFRRAPVPAAEDSKCFLLDDKATTAHNTEHFATGALQISTTFQVGTACFILLMK